jgi:hypothetical protein
LGVEGRVVLRNKECLHAADVCWTAVPQYFERSTYVLVLLAMIALVEMVKHSAIFIFSTMIHYSSKQMTLCFTDVGDAPIP